MRARRPTPVLASVLLAVLTVTGCGEGNGTSDPDGASGPGLSQPTAPPAGDPGEPPDGCDLLTQEEAEAAAGNQVEAGRMLGVVCIWPPVDTEVSRNLQVSVAYVAIPPGAAITVAEFCQQSEMTMADPQRLTDIGNDAYWDYQQGGLSSNGTLAVCLDQGTLTAAAIGQRPEAELQQVARAIASTAMSRL